MYCYSNGQIGLADFKQPVGMKLKESNRWVKKAQTIPWLEIEKRYAALFTNRKGNVAKPLRLALGACIIQAEYGYSDEETALQIQENPYLQYFCGYPGYDDEKLPFAPSLMVYFRKRLTPEVLGEINEIIIQDAKERQAKETESKDDDDSDDTPGTGGNRGTMIVDATCAPSNIRYPQDVCLLNEARENAENLLDVLHDPADGKKPRTYRERARKDYLKYTRCRKHTVTMTRKAIGKQLTYLRRDLDAVDGKLSLGKSLTTRQMERLDTLCTIYEQQKYMHDNHTHRVSDRIVSVSQPFVRPLCGEKPESRWSLVRSWTSVSWMDGPDWNAALLMPTTKLEICRRWQNGSGNGKGIIPAESWQTRSTEIVKISAIAGRMESGYPVRHWDVPRRVRPETRLRITGMSASVWK